MTWLYVLSKYVFFPGSFLKAFCEHLTCRSLHVPVVDADAYFGKGYNCGHVDFLFPKTPGHGFFICLLPGIGNLLLGMPAFAAGCLTLGYLGVDVIDAMNGTFCPLFIVYVLLYLFGASCLCSLFPRVQDIRRLWKMLYGKGSTASAVGKISAFLPTCFLTIGAFLERSAVPALAAIGLLVYWIVT